MRAGFSASTRAIQVSGRPRLTTPSLYTSGTSVSRPGLPNGTTLPSGSTKMFFQPASFIFFGRGEWSLATLEM